MTYGELRARIAQFRRTTTLPEVAERAGPELAALLEKTRALATQCGHEVLAEHFVWAAIDDPSESQVLLACGADRERTRNELARFLNRPAVPQHWTVHWELIEMYARALSINRPLATGHILVGIHEIRCFAGGLLVAQGVSLLRLREYLAHGSVSLDDAPDLPKARLLGGARESNKGRYQLVLHDDDFTVRDFVFEVLRKQFDKSDAEIVAIINTVKQAGTGVIGSYELKTALDKIEKATRMARTGQYPLKITLRPEA